MSTHGNLGCRKVPPYVTGVFATTAPSVKLFQATLDGDVSSPGGLAAIVNASAAIMNNDVALVLSFCPGDVRVIRRKPRVLLTTHMHACMHQTMRLAQMVFGDIKQVALFNVGGIPDFGGDPRRVVQVVPSPRQTVVAALALVRRFGWRHVVLVAPYDTTGGAARRAFYENDGQDELVRTDASFVPGRARFEGFDNPALRAHRVFIVVATSLSDLVGSLVAAYQLGLYDQCGRSFYVLYG